MSGKLNGVQAHIKIIHPLAMYVHYSAHSLNLTVFKSCAEIRDCLSTLGKIRDFFVYPKRKFVLHHQIESSS